MRLRAYADNVILELIEEPTQTASGLQLVQTGRDRTRARRARVVLAGPGAYRRNNRNEARATNGMADASYTFVPTEVKAGDIVFVDEVSGQDYAMDIDVPRHNKGAEFTELFGERGKFRIVREDEIHGVVEP